MNNINKTTTNYCYFHPDEETRLSCNSCGKNICPKCMVESAVGFKCPECAKGHKSHIEHISRKQYLIGGFSGFVIGTGTGFIWLHLSMYGVLISLAVAYAVGFCVSKAISMSIGNKIGFNIQFLTGLITLVSLTYNPIFLASVLLSGSGFVTTLIIMSFSFLSLFKLVAVVIAIWAAIRHFRI